MALPIYLDYHATTPLDPRVFAEMGPYFTPFFGNAASKTHAFGWQAEAAVERARAQVAALLHADPREVIFTSGTTESNNLALKGAIEAVRPSGERRHMITSVIEHDSVLETVRYLEKNGCEATYLPVNPYGQVELAALEKSITEHTLLISIMAANNEIGTIQSLAEIGRIAKSRKVLFHTDAAQAVGKMALDVEAMGIDLLSFSAHKLCGPKGIGGLYMRQKDPRVRLSPQMLGGGHERGMRAGTLNVPAIVGLGQACTLAQSEMIVEQARIGSLRDKLHHALKLAFPDLELNGHPSKRLSGNLNVSFLGIRSDQLIGALSDVALSSGSACASGTATPSHVLQAIGADEARVRGSVRFGLGRFTTESEIDLALARIIPVVQKLQSS